MDAGTIASIVLAVLLAISAVPWVFVWKRGSDLKSAGKDLVERYKNAIADGMITDAEKAEMGEAAVRIVEAGLDIWTTLDNLIRELTKIIQRKSSVRLRR
jgi:hypothetical protein